MLFDCDYLQSQTPCSVKVEPVHAGLFIAATGVAASMPEANKRAVRVEAIMVFMELSP
jgi:hypothetical protein